MITIKEMHAYRQAIGAAFVLMAGLCPAMADAQEQMIPGGQEAFKFNIGGIVTTNNRELRIDGQARGTDLDLEDITGLKSGLSSVFVSGQWRFAPRHRIGVDYFQIDRDASKRIDKTITIGDTVIPINTTLQTESKTQFFITNYQYSFVKNADLEFAGVLGLYGANFKYKFTAANPVVDIDKSTTAPLPLLGLSVDFFLSPRWTASLIGEGLKMKVSSVDGTVYYFGASTDYMVTRNWGVGIGYRRADLRVDVDKGSFNGHVGFRTDSFTMYVQGKF